MTIVHASMSVLPGARAWRAASLACAPVTPLYCSSLFLALYDASCSVGLLHKTYAAVRTQPISFATAAPQATALPSSAGLELDCFSIFVRALDTSSRPSEPFLPFLHRESTPDARNQLFASTAEARVLTRGVKRVGTTE